MKIKRYLIGLSSFMLLSIFLFVVNLYSAALPIAVPEQVGMSSERLSRLDALLDRMIETDAAKGVVVGVARHGKMVYLKARGEMDDGKAMQTDTIFRICSMSKFVTSVALMMLYEEGLFNLNDPVSNYIPEFKETKVLVKDTSAAQGYKLVPPKRAMTIRHLLAHTSGISYAFWGRPIFAEMYIEAGVSDGLAETDATLAENVKKLAKCPLLFHPGDDYEYGLNTDVIGYLVEILSGMHLDKFFEQRIFNPLGMKDTYFFLPADKISRLAAIYEDDGTGHLRKLTDKVTRPGIIDPNFNTNVYDPTYSYQGPRRYFSGGAGLNSTVEDYVRFCQMILNGGELNGIRLLSPLTIELMMRDHGGNTKPWIIEDGWHTAMGGFTLEDRDQVGHIMANGTFTWEGFYRTKFEIDFKNNLIYMLFTQRSPLLPHLIALPDEFNKLRVLTHAAVVDD